MELGKARAIFDDIENASVNNADKLEAIYAVADMKTHNSVSKRTVLNVMRWMLAHMELRY